MRTAEKEFCVIPVLASFGEESIRTVSAVILTSVFVANSF